MSQRDYMWVLYQKFGNREYELVSGYAEAERQGFVQRVRNQAELNSEQYARALYRDGIRKEWLQQAPRSK
ncbi:MAG: hypothetical protein HGA97_12605 [Chlorobiaceae bacterium]|jgi:hypothetical protein|nr:hypothetical protein [Chlorobiaceae bacterium]